MTKPRMIKLLITLSVLLNVLFIGTFGGMAYKKYRHHQEMREAHEGLSPEARHLVARTMQQKHREVREIMKEAKEAQGALVKILEADEFNEDEFDAAISELKAAHEQAAGLKIEATRTLAKELSADERKKLAKRLSGFFDKRRHRVSKKFKSFETSPSEQSRD